MNKSTRFVFAGIAILIVGVIVLLKLVLPAALKVAMSTMEMRFPEVTWHSESSLMIPASNREPLDAAWKALQAGRKGPPAEGHFAEVGKLTLPSGQLFATDLNFPEDNVPFRLKVPPGQYSVFEVHQESGSFVAVLVREDQPVKWVLADSVEDTRPDLESDEGLWGISLDSSAILVDGLACDKQLTYNPTNFFDGKTRSLTIEPSSGLNVVCVELGGVGVHPAYWGINAASEPVVLMVVPGWQQNGAEEADIKL